MDLGKHTVRFEYQGQTKEDEVIIGAGQKNRNVTVTFVPAVVAPTPPTGPTTPEGSKEGSIVPALVVGGIGVVALGSFAIFGLGGKSDVSDLESTCKPHCTESQVNSARTKLIIADISLGVGIVALGVATYLILTRPKVDAEIKTGHALVPPPPRKATALSDVSFDFGPTIGGAVGSVGARF
jgi:hypothetical protein